MKHFISIILLLIFICKINAQTSKKKILYSGTKVHISHLGKSNMFIEGVKHCDYTITRNLKKNIITVKAGEQKNWYQIKITSTDTLQGDIMSKGYLKNLTQSNHPENDLICETHFHLDKIAIKIEGTRIEEYLLDGATIWAGKKVKNIK